MRNLSGALITALQAEAGVEKVFLISINFSGGTTYFTTGSRDLEWDSQTWEAVGGSLHIPGIEQSGDLKGAGAELILSGVSQAITAVLLGQDYRGRTVQIWQAVLDQDLGTVIGTIPLVTKGLQLDAYVIEEKINRGTKTAIIRTRIRHRLSVREFRGIRSNLASHQQYHVDDTFFQHTPTLANKKLYWGTTAPAGGRPGGTGGGIPSDDERGDGPNITVNT